MKLPMRRGPMLLMLAGCLALCMLMLTGCAGYKLGPTSGAAAGEQTVQITPFVNRTLEPRLGDAVTASLRKTVQRDGTYRLATQGKGDIVVNGVLTKYWRDELSFVPRDVLTVRDYRVSVSAQVTATEVSTGKVLLDQEVTGYTLVRVGSDLTSAERQARSVLADDLARNITDLLVDGSW